MWPFGKKARVYRTVESLIVYNDKGRHWSGHTERQVQDHRAALMSDIVDAVNKIERDALPTDFLSALDSGDLSRDATGRILIELKRHFDG